MVPAAHGPEATDGEEGLGAVGAWRRGAEVEQRNQGRGARPSEALCSPSRGQQKDGGRHGGGERRPEEAGGDKGRGRSCAVAGKGIERGLRCSSRVWCAGLRRVRVLVEGPGCKKKKRRGEKERERK